MFPGLRPESGRLGCELPPTTFPGKRGGACEHLLGAQCALPNTDPISGVHIFISLMEKLKLKVLAQG